MSLLEVPCRHCRQLPSHIPGTLPAPSEKGGKNLEDKKYCNEIIKHWVQGKSGSMHHSGGTCLEEETVEAYLAASRASEQASVAWQTYSKELLNGFLHLLISVRTSLVSCET